ncbi:MAG: hypothetical protein ACLSAC_00305 [Enterocloster bolteae]
MLSNIQRNIIIRALQIRKSQGEEPADILDGYRNLTEDEKEEILVVLKNRKGEVNENEIIRQM